MPKCIFGIGTYLCLFLGCGLKMTAVGLECKPVHEIIIEPYEIFKHDIKHNKELTDIVKIIGKKRLRIILELILDSNNKKCLIFYIYILIHENNNTNNFRNFNLEDIRNISEAFFNFTKDQSEDFKYDNNKYIEFCQNILGFNIDDLEEPPNWVYEDNFIRRNNFFDKLPIKVLYYLNTEFRRILALEPRTSL